MPELYKKYRPTMLKQVLGQQHITRVLQRHLKDEDLPHAILISGPSGCGKTTIGRILRKKMKCFDEDFIELNAAKCRGIDEVRDIDARIGYCYGNTRFWILDEAHKLTNDAQNALLKILEDTPDHAYFILCTTVPQKLIATVRNRCTEFAVKPLKEEQLKELLEHVISGEEATISTKVRERIVKHCNGSGRKCLVMLEKVLKEDSEEDQLDAVLAVDTETKAFELVRMLIWQKADWSKIAQFLKDYEEKEKDAEGIRHLILACAKTELLKNNSFRERAYNIINAFRDPYYDCGFPGLVASCFEVVHPK